MGIKTDAILMMFFYFSAIKKYIGDAKEGQD
jgi:hypothetical protein